MLSLTSIQLRHLLFVVFLFNVSFYSQVEKFPVYISTTLKEEYWSAKNALFLHIFSTLLNKQTSANFETDKYEVDIRRVGLF